MSDNMKKALLTFFFIGLIAAFGLQSQAHVPNDPDVEINGSISLGQNYPNPAIDKTYVNVDFESSTATLTIYNVLGKMIERRQITSGLITIDVSDFKEGIYLYTLDADGQKLTKRMTVKRR